MPEFPLLQNSYIMRNYIFLAFAFCCWSSIYRFLPFIIKARLICKLWNKGPSRLLWYCGYIILVTNLGFLSLKDWEWTVYRFHLLYTLMLHFLVYWTICSFPWWSNWETVVWTRINKDIKPQFIPGLFRYPNHNISFWLSLEIVI